MKNDSISLSEDNVVRKIYLQSLGAYILSDIAYTSGPLVDGIVTGNFIGVQAVAAVCLLSPAILVFTFMSGILSKGSRSIYTELLGKGKLDEANAVFTVANVFSVIVSLVIAAAGMLFANQIMRFLGASGQNSHLEGLGADYLRGVSARPCVPELRKAHQRLHDHRQRLFQKLLRGNSYDSGEHCRRFLHSALYGLGNVRAWPCNVS